MLALFLSFLAWFAPAPAAPPGDQLYPLPETMAFAVLGDQVLLLHPDRSSTLVPIAAVVIVPGSLPNGWGFPSLATAQLPHVYETVYVSASGTHTVRTPCAAYTGLVGCARAHQAAVAALQALFPKVAMLWRRPAENLPRAA